MIINKKNDIKVQYDDKIRGMANIQGENCLYKKSIIDDFIFVLEIFSTYFNVIGYGIAIEYCIT